MPLAFASSSRDLDYCGEKKTFWEDKSQHEQLLQQNRDRCARMKSSVIQLGQQMPRVWIVKSRLVGALLASGLCLPNRTAVWSQDGHQPACSVERTCQLSFCGENQGGFQELKEVGREYNWVIQFSKIQLKLYHMLCILTQVLIIYFESNSGLLQGRHAFIVVDRLAFIPTPLTLIQLLKWLWMFYGIGNSKS